MVELIRVPTGWAVEGLVVFKVMIKISSDGLVVNQMTSKLVVLTVSDFINFLDSCLQDHIPASCRPTWKNSTCLGIFDMSET